MCECIPLTRHTSSLNLNNSIVFHHPGIVLCLSFPVSVDINSINCNLYMIHYFKCVTGVLCNVCNHSLYDMDIGPAGSTLGIGTGNVRASRTGPGPNIP